MAIESRVHLRLLLLRKELRFPYQVSEEIAKDLLNKRKKNKAMGDETGQTGESEYYRWLNKDKAGLELEPIRSAYIHVHGRERPQELGER